MEQLPKIVQQRLQATAKVGAHPDPDLLTAFVEKSLNERERAPVLQHLAQCADCRKVVSLAMPEMVAPSTTPVRSRWLTWPVLRWGALAACALVVTAAVTLRYESRLREPVVADKAPGPAPSSTVTLESRASDQPGQKLAEKILPPSPLPSRSDRAFDSVGMLAKQRDDTRTMSAAGAAVVSELQTEKPESQPGENSVPEIGSGRRAELADNQRAKTDGFRSLHRDKPAAPIMGQFAASSPPSSAPAVKSKTASAEEQVKEGNESLDYAAKANSQTVTAEAVAPLIQTTQATAGGAKDESDKKVENAAAAGEAKSANALRNVKRQGIVGKTAWRWTLSSDGSLQRSFDSGKTWQTVPVADNLKFRALAANDADIWVGGAAGALYHSSDAGQHWTQVKPVAGGKLLTSDIVGVEFTDSQSGKVITSDRESWTTGDGGASWHRY